VVVAPHPDDEVLAAGGALAVAAASGRSLLVVAVTEGGASHPGSSRWPVGELVRQRARERADALRELGVLPGPDGLPVAALHLPDGGVTARIEELTQLLTELLTAADVVVSPWVFDGHPDHEATAVATGAAAAAVGCSALQAPIWGWHWVSPGSQVLDGLDAVRLDLAPPVLARKRAAVACFGSQLEPDPSTGAEAILPDWALARLLRDREVFLR
jgi:LmbE family N-acetylglucosaminyl deacetylase